VEFLVPDFRGDERALETVVSARPEVLGHNLEVPEALYPAIGRPADGYGRSLRLLEEAARRGALTKSGLMLGLGESAADVLRTLADLRRAGCGLLTLGQYLQPARGRAPVRRYCSPEEFDRWKRTALEMGFLAVEAGPLVRSSYRAHGLAGRASARLEA
jgi:lipoic acid synthetase